MVSPLVKAFSGDSGSGPAPPTLPAPLPPAIQPTTKPGSKGIQSSFLSGVAGAQPSGSTGGKTLLGQ